MQATKRIICVGNRLFADDAAGPATYAELVRQPLPPDVTVIDGGLAGLALLPLIEGAALVVFVDAIIDSTTPPGVYLLDAAEVGGQATPAYGHGAGLAYLLRLLPRVLDGDLPQVCVVGIAGGPDPAAIARAAGLSLALVDAGVVPAPPVLTGVAE